MFRFAFLFACLLCFVGAANAATTSADFARYPKNKKILPGNHRPLYTRYGHHSLSRQGLRSLFRFNGPGRATKKPHLVKAQTQTKTHRGTL